MTLGDLPVIGYLPIGVAHSALVTREAPHVQGSFSQAEGGIGVSHGFRKGLRDIGGFSHVTIMIDFDRAEKRTLDKKTLLDGEAGRGIFTTRHVSRPSPIGISDVTVAGINDGITAVKGIGLPGAIPVLDIKPFLAAFDSIPDARTGRVTAEHVARLREAGTGAGHRSPQRRIR